MPRLLKKLAFVIFSLAIEASLVMVVVTSVIFVRNRHRELVWGPVPILNNKYWSLAMKRAGWSSTTLMETVYESANGQEDFDVLFDGLVPAWISNVWIRHAYGRLAAFGYILRNASVVHIPVSGGPLGEFRFWKLEAQLLRVCGIKTVVIPFGGDVWLYSRIEDPCVHHGLLACYPDAARREGYIEQRLRYWEKNADAMIGGFLIDGRARWDVTVPNFITIDLEEWKRKKRYAAGDGEDAVVVILHSPNHRDYKGTEFLEQSVEELRKEGMLVELTVLEGVKNRAVREAMLRADIFADQFINTGYGLAAIEAMACGLPVLGNLELEVRTKIFRQYAYLDECPIVSAPPEHLTSTLRRLISEPELRRMLGLAGREYVEKYHGDRAAQYLFSSIYRKILNNEEIELINLYHPLKSSFVNGSSKVSHPLVKNRLPSVS